MKIVLIGYMGSGKSAVGQRLASKFKFPFIDLDREIEIMEERTISEIFSEKGEIYFRKAELKMLKEILGKENNLILATGGGTPCYSNVMELINSNKDCITVYLNTSLNTLADRLFIEKSKRPLISHLSTQEELNDFVAKHLFERSFYYNQSLKKVITDGLTLEEVVESIIQIIK